jgi:pSer/pThr/pTyr-binding forkhead associated (FHA) protein
MRWFVAFGQDLADVDRGTRWHGRLLFVAYTFLMIDTTDWSAWLEDANGNRTPIRGSCSLGRSESNQVTLQDETVSRRHAVIQAQGEQEFWLVDFGSRNGSYVNGQRIAQPTRLRDGARVAIGGFQYVFRQPRFTATVQFATPASDQTVIDVRSAKCWLLVADIVDSTKLIADLPADTLPLVTGRWLAQCKEVIEASGGRINQFLGDGFFAFWHDREGMEGSIDQALRSLRQFQAESRPVFRVVAHFGSVILGGISVGEEERISGSEVHFVFRMEKLAGSLGEPRLLSEAAKRRLARLVEARDAGCHSLHGFDSQFRFYAF